MPNTIGFEMSERLGKLPPYLFAEIDRLKREAVAKGRDIIDMGVGDPDTPTPSFIIEALNRASRDAQNHRYALDAGMPQLRKAIAEWYESRYEVRLDPEREILPLIGSKEGIAHMPLAILNPGEVALIPDPGYPPYRSGTVFAGGVPCLMPLLAENHFLPDLGDIDETQLKRAKMMFLNYPNNPTTACAPLEFMEEALRFGKKNGLAICYDAAYAEMGFEGYEAPSFLGIEGAKERCIEFHSLSKTFSMTGWRIGFAVGNADLIRFLGKIKSNVDSGIFQAVQWAGVTALREGAEEARKILKIYEERRNVLVTGLRKLGWENIEMPAATFYVWIPVPPGYTSQEITLKFLREADIVVTPGNGFGANGEGYFRIALTVPKQRIQEALERIAKIKAGKAKRP
ncbi:MAG TPA: LL-diaminopimelate aminotransferase [Candidatus Omnitrophota bacterium]|nr:LL-diaminopimelate aminotransferase [Candidatus Omnitrophota bacterium]